MVIHVHRRTLNATILTLAPLIDQFASSLFSVGQDLRWMVAKSRARATRTRHTARG